MADDIRHERSGSNHDAGNNIFIEGLFPGADEIKNPSLEDIINEEKDSFGAAIIKQVNPRAALEELNHQAGPSAFGRGFGQQFSVTSASEQPKKEEKRVESLPMKEPEPPPIEARGAERATEIPKRKLEPVLKPKPDFDTEQTQPFNSPSSADSGELPKELVKGLSKDFQEEHSLTPKPIRIIAKVVAGVAVGGIIAGAIFGAKKYRDKHSKP